MQLQFIQTDAAPIPAGHYSQAVCANGFIYVAGLLPIIPKTNREIPEGIEKQADQVFANLRAILQAAGSDVDKVVSVQIFIPNIELWSTINARYSAFFGNHKPARTIIPCGPLHYDVSLEVNAVAVSA